MPDARCWTLNSPTARQRRAPGLPPPARPHRGRKGARLQTVWPVTRKERRPCAGMGGGGWLWALHLPWPSGRAMHPAGPFNWRQPVLAGLRRWPMAARLRPEGPGCQGALAACRAAACRLGALQESAAVGRMPSGIWRRPPGRCRGMGRGVLSALGMPRLQGRGGAQPWRQAMRRGAARKLSAASAAACGLRRTRPCAPGAGCAIMAGSLYGGLPALVTRHAHACRAFFFLIRPQAQH